MFKSTRRARTSFEDLIVTISDFVHLIDTDFAVVKGSNPVWSPLKNCQVTDFVCYLANYLDRCCTGTDDADPLIT